MKKNLILLISIFPILSACNSNVLSTSSNSESSGESSSIVTTSTSNEDTSSITTSSTTKTTSTTSEIPSTSEDTSSSTLPEPPVVEENSIASVVNECRLLSTPTSQPHIAMNENKKFTIKGHVIQNLVSGTTKAGYTPDGKTMLIDDTGWILCSSSSASKTSLYQKVNDYVDKDTTQYVVTGYIALVFNTPELVVESFTWNQNLDIDYGNTLNDVNIFDSVSSYYSDTYENVEYNIKGNGIGELVKIKNLTCVGRADNASTGKWAFIDKNNHYLDVLYATNTNAFVPGQVYDLVGLQNIYHYNASFRALRHENSNDSIRTHIDENKAVNTTIKALFDNYSFKDDSYNKVSTSYFNNKMNIYKATVYVNHFEKNGKWYVTLSDNDYTPSAENDAYIHYQAPINNDGYWASSENSFSYHNLYYYENTGDTVTVYFSLYQENHVSVDPIKNKAIWKLYLYEDMVPEPILE